MAKTFLAQVPVSQITAAFAQARSGGPLTLTAYINSAPTAGQASLTRPDGQRLLVTLATDGTGLISSLLVRPVPPLPTVHTAADLYRAGQSLGAWTSVLVATIGPDGTCRPSQQFGDEGPRPTGSMFKLYVLGAVVQAVQAKGLSWDRQLTVTQDVLSLPSGQLQNAPVGTKVTVRQAAQLMIQISDNTAADLLIGAIGQPALTAVQAMGNTRPLLLKPFLTTRQMFALQYDAPTLRSQWAAALPGLVDPATGTVSEPTTSTVDARTTLLGRLPTGPPTITPGSTRPGWGTASSGTPPRATSARPRRPCTAGRRPRPGSRSPRSSPPTRVSTSVPAGPMSATRAARTPAC
jgi:beta-lactamase class A